MRLKSIKCENYRQYVDIRINFEKSTEYDMHILKARNGIGKTTILNAINWCLYGDEPHSSGIRNDGSKSDVIRNNKLPIYNQEAPENALNEGLDTFNVSVTIELEHKGEVYEIIRCQEYDAKRKIQKDKDDYRGYILPLDGETKSLKPEEIEQIREKFLPKSIRECFYFDGEQLDYYFDGRKSAKIKENVYVIAQIKVLDQVERNLEDLEKRYKKAVRDACPDISQFEKRYDAAIKASNDKKSLIEEKQKENEEIENEIRKISDEISGRENAKNIDELYEQWKDVLKECESKQIELNRKLRDFNVKYFIKLALFNTNKSNVEYISKRKEEGTVSSFDFEEIKRCLDNNECTLCGANLSIEAVQKLKKLLSSMEYNESSRKLSDINKYILKSIEVEQFENEKEEILSDIRKNEKALNDAKEKTNQLHMRINELGGSEAAEEVKRLLNKKECLQSRLKLNSEAIGKYKEQLASLENKELIEKNALETAIANTKYCEGTKEKYNFAKNAHSIIAKIKKDIECVMRQKIEKETFDIFTKLEWKKDAFSRVELSADYILNLYSKKTDESCAGSLSAAERELLALAFILAIHSVSGYNSFLFIDTPVGKISDENRVNFASVLRDISREKQIVIAFTPSEYSSEISEILYPGVVSSFTELEMVDGISRVVS